MTDASLPIAVTHRSLPTGMAGWWLVVGTLVLVDLIGLPLANISVDWASMRNTFLVAGLFLVYGLALDQVRQRAG
jgi:hypothetical protein